ncbi:MAG: hypothetical protein ABFD84_00220 [Candidatus Polarisedimenticolia bacterium]|nr:hypothetical protein [bacterium]
MKRTYHCPHCDGLLNPNVKIILKAEAAAGPGLVLFSPRPGNYEAIVAEDLHIKKKETVRFSCPLCGKDLTSSRDRTMAEINFVSPSGQEGRVVFSRVFGHHETYFVTDEQVSGYGGHIGEDQLNFWGMGPRR